MCSEPAHRSELGSLLPLLSRVSFSHGAAPTVHARRGRDLRRLVGSGVAPPSSAQQSCCGELATAAEPQSCCCPFVQRWRRHLRQPQYSPPHPSSSPRQHAPSAQSSKYERSDRDGSMSLGGLARLLREVTVLPDGSTRVSQRHQGETLLRPCSG